MIIVRLKGGLGNQMFQYAAARRLASVHDVPLKLDLSWFSNDLSSVTSRSFALSPLSIHAEAATKQELADFCESYSGRLKLLLGFMNFNCRNKHIKEEYFHFNPSILELSDNVLLDGYWQSEKYFIDSASAIRSDFTISSEPNHRNRELLSEISSGNSISIHIRRGDYVSDAKIASHHGLCSDTYYAKAVKIAAEMVERPHFFVFSDDPEWVRSNFKISYPMTLVDNNGTDRAFEDLRLMSHCRHHIIANSSFSWWGAWLSQYAYKQVIAPMRWFNDPAVNTIDLFPDTWIRIES